MFLKKTLFFPDFKNEVLKLRTFGMCRGRRILTPSQRPLLIILWCLFRCWFLSFFFFLLCAVFLYIVKIIYTQFSILCNHNFNGYIVLHHFTMNPFPNVGHLGCFQFFFIINNIVIIIFVHTSLYEFPIISFKIYFQKSHYWVKEWTF